MIGERFNFEDVFFRDLTVCVLDTFEGQVRWVNRFSSGDVAVNVPFYYSLTGDERFLLDSFQDDIVSENRFVELNTDIIPRGHLTMTGFNIKSDEFANPNVWLRMVVENEFEIRKILARVRAIPITVNYDLTITLSSEIDTFKCAQALMDTMWIYKFMYFEHNFMNIDAVILMPDTNQIEMTREQNLTSDNSIKVKASFEVHTYYPAFRRDRVSMTGYPQTYGSGQTDPNNWTLQTDPNIDININGRPFNFPQEPLPSSGTTLGGTESGGGFGATGSWVDGTYPGNIFAAFGYPGDGSGQNGPARSVNKDGQLTGDPDYYMISPKRTRWFNNILQARQKSTTGTNNPNGRNPNKNQNGKK
jgi:hypothetical protein